MTNSKDVSVIFAEQELTVIRDIFNGLESDSLEKWLDLIPKEGEPLSEACNLQWKITDVYSQIRHKSGVVLGIEQEVTDAEVQEILREYDFPRKP